MSGCDWQKPKFSVPLGLSKQGQKNYNKIFRKPLKKKIKERINNLLYRIFWEK